MADQGPISRRYFEGATEARGSVATGKRPRAPLRAAAWVLSAVAKIESRDRVVTREGSNVCCSRRIRLDHESRRFRIDHGLPEQEWRPRILLRNPQHGPHVSALFESCRRIYGKAGTVRSKSDRTVS